jgi:hypothetical protein
VKKVLDLDDFNERAKDVSDYLYFLRDLEQSQILLSKNGAISKIDSELDIKFKSDWIFTTLQFYRIYYEKCYPNYF